MLIEGQPATAIIRGVPVSIEATTISDITKKVIFTINGAKLGETTTASQNSQLNLNINYNVMNSCTLKIYKGVIGGILIALGKAIILITALFLFAHLFIYRLFSVAAKSQEILFLLSLAWVLLAGFLFSYLGFSLEIGALIAGMALAQSKYSLEIAGKLKGLRDFFVVIFFVFFGSQLIGPITSKMVAQAVIFSFFILVGKPLIVMASMKFFGGYKKRTNFLTGISLAQISEMSLIIILLGFN